MRQAEVTRRATAVTIRSQLAGHPRGTAVPENTCPVRWAGQQAVVTLPEHMDVPNAGQIREELLSVINRGARALIADMTATATSRHAGADAVVPPSPRGGMIGAGLRLGVY